MLRRIDEAHVAELAFAADAGHRLRTPVATLRAEAELALRDPGPEARTMALQQIIADADHLGVIVDQMLARGRTRALKPAVVTDLISKGSTRWRRQAELAEVRLSVQVDPMLPVQLRSDNLLDVVEPLIENAIRHTPSGDNVTVRVTAVLSDPSAKPQRTRPRIEVTNTGEPVPAELAPRVFDAWVSSRPGSEAGGLGLWIARETARDVGGEVSLDPSVAGQTTFRVDLPT